MTPKLFDCQFFSTAPNMSQIAAQPMGEAEIDPSLDSGDIRCFNDILSS